jgi:signal transduction histidine kinase
MLEPLTRCVRSLFTRLALVMIVAAVVVNVVTYELFFNFQHGRETSFNRNLAEYAHTLARDLGTPPDRAKAEALGARLRMRITFEGDTPWQAGVTGEPFPEEHLRPWFANKTVEASSLHGYHRIRTRTAAGVLVFDIFPSAREQADLHRFGLLYLGSTCLVFLLAYGLMRYLLRPVRWLTDGAAAVRDGDLGHRVPVRRGGELKDLSRTFNEMATRLEGIVQGQQRLLLGVSHELRTPLTRLKLRLELLDPQDREEGMREDIREMESMITVLLESARMRHEASTLDPVDTDLKALVMDVARRHEGRRPGLTLFLPAGPLHVRVDPLGVGTLVGNLIDNALKYSRPDSPPVEVGLECARGVPVIIVRDHGIGIREEDAAHLFEPFFRVDESRTRESGDTSGGFGLGLHLCQGIAKAHGGTIDLESEPGKGTTVTVTLPRQTCLR